VAARARILNISAEMLDDGARLHIVVDLPTPPSDLSPVAEAAAG
jgi:hypothetical protein